MQPKCSTCRYFALVNQYSHINHSTLEILYEDCEVCTCNPPSVFLVFETIETVSVFPVVQSDWKCGRYECDYKLSGRR